MHEDHGSVFGEDPIEPIPDRAVIVEVDAAGERDYGALRDRRLDLRPMLRFASRSLPAPASRTLLALSHHNLCRRGCSLTVRL